MSNWEIIGHEWAVDYLRRSIAAGHDAHAYLFTGPAGIGKGLLATRLAQRLVCETGGLDPCLHCRGCKRVASGNHPDVRRFSLAQQAAASKDAARSRELKIDSIRTWQQDIAMRPFEASRRVFILEDAETLNDQAANALLKTLEEPPPYAVLVLIAQGNGDLLPTVVSRCRVMKLRPLARSTVAAALGAQFGVASEDAQVRAALCEGRIGRAIAALREPEALAKEQEHLDELDNLRTRSRPERLKWAEERAREYRGDPDAVERWLELWQSWWRDVLLLAGEYPAGLVHLDRVAGLQAVAREVQPAAIGRFLQRVNEVRQQLADNVNPQLALEHLVLHLP